jgi:hypothetical protein
LVAKDLLKVLYAPHKVFKEIIQKPGYLGPLLLLLIFVVAQVGGAYVVSSRSYVETTTPQTVPLSAQGDLWTETAAYWKANEGVTVRNNTVDYVNTTYAATSIEFRASDASNVWMEINFESVNCSTGAFQNVSFRVKQVTPDAAPENVSLYLYSLSDSNFYHDLTSKFSNSAVNVWNNITLTVGAGSEGWVSSGASATWENITGLKLDFAWSESADVDLRVDQLFFKGNYQELYELYGVAYLANAALNAFAPFLFEWLLLTGLMYLMIKGLKGNVIWRPLMVAVGFALVVIVIQAAITSVVYTTLPNLYYPIEVLAGPTGEFQTSYQVILDQIASVNMVGYILQIAMWVWTVTLGAFIVRAITSDKKIAEQLSMGKTAPEATPSAPSIEVAGFSWMQCLMVSGVSVLLTVIILGLLGV